MAFYHVFRVFPSIGFFSRLMRSSIKFFIHRNCREDVPPGIRQAIVAIHVRRASDAAVVQIAAPEELPDPISPYIIFFVTLNRLYFHTVKFIILKSFVAIGGDSPSVRLSPAIHPVPALGERVARKFHQALVRPALPNTHDGPATPP